VPLVRLERTTY